MPKTRSILFDRIPTCDNLSQRIVTLNYCVLYKYSYLLTYTNRRTRTDTGPSYLVIDYLVPLLAQRRAGKTRPTFEVAGEPNRSLQTDVDSNRYRISRERPSTITARSGRARQ